jgi:hypothetical protein
MTHTRARPRFRTVLAAVCSLAALAPSVFAQTPAPPPIALGDDVVFSSAIRTRTYDWNFFGDTPNGDYTYQGTQVRFGITQTKKAYDWQLEFEVPFMIHLPTTAVQPPPQGQLGLGANYYAANDNSENPAAIFLKQGYVRFKGLGGVDGQSLKVGRFEYNDGLETTPKNGTLTALNRDRISQRVLGNFGFSDVLRSLDGGQYVFNTPKLNVTAVAARPTEGVFQVNGWNELHINVFYGALTGQGGSEKNPSLWRVFALGYHDYRAYGSGLVKTDNRSAAAKAADTENINIGTYGGNVLQVAATQAGPVDLMFWGVLQAGSWGTLSHRAGAMAAEIGWQPSPLPSLKPWIRAGYDYSSGDSNPTDDRHGTFFQVLPTARVYARMPFFNLINNVDAFGELILRPASRLTIRSDIHALSLADSHDLWYSGGGAFQPNSFGFSGRPSNGHTSLATLYDVQGDITINPHVALALYYAYAHSGDVAYTIFPTSAGGHLAYVEWLIRF